MTNKHDDYLLRVERDACGLYFTKVEKAEKHKPREWEIICAGGLMLAEGWQLKKGERVKVVEKLQ